MSSTLSGILVRFQKTLFSTHRIAAIVFVLLSHVIFARPEFALDATCAVNKTAESSFVTLHPKIDSLNVAVHAVHSAQPVWMICELNT